MCRWYSTVDSREFVPLQPILIPSAEHLTCRIVEDLANTLEYLAHARELSAYGVRLVAEAALERAKHPETSYL